MLILNKVFFILPILILNLSCSPKKKEDKTNSPAVLSQKTLPDSADNLSQKPKTLNLSLEVKDIVFKHYANGVKTKEETLSFELPSFRFSIAPEVSSFLIEDSKKNHFQLAFIGGSLDVLDIKTSQALKKGCYQFALDSLSQSLLIPDDKNLETMLEKSESPFEIIAAGELCLDDTGTIISVSDNAPFSLPILSHENLKAYLSKNLIVNPKNQTGLGLWGKPKIKVLEGEGEVDAFKQQVKIDGTTQISSTVRKAGEDKDIKIMNNDKSLNFYNNYFLRKSLEKMNEKLVGSKLTPKLIDTMIEQIGEAYKSVKDIDMEFSFGGEYAFTLKIRSSKYLKTMQNIEITRQFPKEGEVKVTLPENFNSGSDIANLEIFIDSEQEQALISEAQEAIGSEHVNDGLKNLKLSDNAIKKVKEDLIKLYIKQEKISSLKEDYQPFIFNIKVGSVEKSFELVFVPLKSEGSRAFTYIKSASPFNKISSPLIHNP